MTSENEKVIAEIIASAEGSKPRLLVEPASPDRTVAALRDQLGAQGNLFDRGVPVRLAHNQTEGGTLAQALTPDGLVLFTHGICRPYEIKQKRDGTFYEKDVRLPRQFATMFLEWRGEWKLRPLNGIATAPLLHEDGTIGSAQGYDPQTGMWCEKVPDLAGLIPNRPTDEQAEAALKRVRDTFKTFCFADAETTEDSTAGVPIVDLTKSAGRDESAFLVALLTAVCRPSLRHAPGILLHAASLSGAGAGKGLLARCTCDIAFGREPHAVTAGTTGEELEKRIAAELIEGSPALFLDNLNNMVLKSDLLASAITERPAKVRLLGKSQMVPLNASALVLLTGNGLSISEDLARRFIEIELDPRTENPEARPFTNDIRAEVKASRRELLSALLTIWKWGRTTSGITSRLPFGNFEQWGKWVRDPLVALGCRDPVERVNEAKERDGRRQAVAEAFARWWQIHGSAPVMLRDLHEDVKNIVDPQGRSRQHLSSVLQKWAGTRVAGFVLTRQAPAGTWGVASYALKKTDEQDHRGHGGHGAAANISDAPDASDDPDDPDADLHRKAA